MGFTHPATRLCKQRPPERLMSLGIWLPVIMQFATCVAFQVCVGEIGAALHQLLLLFLLLLHLALHPAPPTRPPPSPFPLPPQLLALWQLTRQPWYQRFDPHPEGTNCFDRRQANTAVCSRSHENSTVFLMSLGQYLVAALVFNKGPPFRKPIYTNPWLLLGAGAVRLGDGIGWDWGGIGWACCSLGAVP